MSKAKGKNFTKTFVAMVSPQAGERAVVAVVSSNSVDRDGDSLQPMGCNSSEYEKNPVLLFMHNWGDSGTVAEKLPIGRCESLKRTQDTLIAKFTFPKRPDNHPENSEWLPDTVFSLFQAGVLNAFSVGFQVLESRMPTKRDVELLGDNVRQIISKWLVFEISVVSLPANPDCVALAVSKGFITQQRADQLFGKDATTGIPPQQEVFPNQTRNCLKCKAATTHADGTQWGSGYLCGTCAALPATCKSCKGEMTLADMQVPDDWDWEDWDNFDCQDCSAEPAKRLIINVDASPGQPAKRLIISDWQPRVKLNPKRIEYMAKARIAKLRGRIEEIEDVPPLMIEDDGGEE